jgi:hypothetical protein
MYSVIIFLVFTGCYAASIIALTVEAVSTSETSLNFYQITWCYNPEGSHLHTRCCENLKF